MQIKKSFIAAVTLATFVAAIPVPASSPAGNALVARQGGGQGGGGQGGGQGGGHGGQGGGHGGQGGHGGGKGGHGGH